MHNELTKKDIQMMKDELDYRRIQLRPQLLEAVKEARAFGDLSENFEYKLSLIHIWWRTMNASAQGRVDSLSS